MIRNEHWESLFCMDGVLTGHLRKNSLPVMKGMKLSFLDRMNAILGELGEKCSS